MSTAVGASGAVAVSPGAASPGPGGDPVARRLTHLPWGLAAAVAVAAVGAPLGWILGGGSGAIGVISGVVLVVVSFSFSSVAIAVADAIRPDLVLPFGMGAYIVKFTAFGVVMAVIAGRHWPGLRAMAAAIAVAAVAWSAAQVLWLVRTQYPYRQPGAPQVSEAPRASGAPQGVRGAPGVRGTPGVRGAPGVRGTPGA